MAPDGKMRGPATVPSSMARLSPNAGPPMSRTVVKPAHQRGGGLGACHEIEMADVPREQRCGRRPHQHRMPVHVDQPGHQRAPAALDEHGGGAPIGRDRTCGDTFDLIPAHQNVSRR